MILIAGDSMLRRFYDRIIALAESPRPWWLALGFIRRELVFPHPADAMLIPMVFAKPQRAWIIAAVCTIASSPAAFSG